MTNSSEADKLITVRDQFLSVREKAVFEALCPEVNPKAKKTATEVSVYQVPRLGYSRAKVYIAIFGDGRPYVVKIDQTDRVAQEWERIEAIQRFFDDSIAGRPPVLNVDGLGGLPYVHFAARHRADIEDGGPTDSGEFENRLRNPSVQPSKLAEILEGVYKGRLDIAHNAVKREEIELLATYADVEGERDYLRGNVSRERIASLLGETDDSRTYVDLQGLLLFNPLYARTHFFRSPVKCSVGPIHGDLHPRNIIIGENDSPHLIDFKWSNPTGHLLVDFVILETSIRFFQLPRYYNLQEQFHLNDLLVDEHGEHEAPSPHHPTDETTRYHEVLTTLIDVIRTCARDAAGEGYTFEEYLASQFLVLYGVLRIRNCEQLPAVHALGRIAERLSGSPFGQVA